jgi:hypothetical protein
VDRVSVPSPLARPNWTTAFLSFARAKELNMQVSSTLSRGTDWTI